MSSLLEDLKAVLKRDGYGLEDIECCIGRVRRPKKGQPWNLAVRHLKCGGFLEAASRVAVDASSKESGVWTVDPTTGVAMKDGTRYYWGLESGVEGWVKRSGIDVQARMPAVEASADEIVLTPSGEDDGLP